jgi:hypothetical protein
MIPVVNFYDLDYKKKLYETKKQGGKPPSFSNGFSLNIKDLEDVKRLIKE